MQSKYTTGVTKNVVKLCRDLLLSAVVLGETNLVSCRHTLDPARPWTAAVGTGDGVPSWADHHHLLLLVAAAFRLSAREQHCSQVTSNSVHDGSEQLHGSLLLLRLL